MLALARAGPFGVSSRSTPPHVLSDTPSYLRARGVVSRLFSDDVDVSMWKAEVPDWGSNHTSWKPGVCDCSGRGSCPQNSTVCQCSSGHSGAHCQYAGTAWVMAPLPSTVPRARTYHTLTPVGDRLYMFGGMAYINGKANRLNDLHYLDVKSRRWTTPYSTGHWPAHRTSHTATLLVGPLSGPRLFVFGGINGKDAYCADLDVYDVAKQTWSRLAIEGGPPTRARHTAVALGGERAGALMVFGGAAYKSRLQLFNDVWILSTDSSPPRWNAPPILGPRPRPRSGHTATLLEDPSTVVVFGGDAGTDPAVTDPADGYVNDVWLFSLTTGWAHKNVSGDVPEPRTLHTATRVGQWLAVTGGDMAGVPLASGELIQVYLLDLEHFVWHKLRPRGNVPYGRFGHQAALLQNSIVAVGARLPSAASARPCPQSTQSDPPPAPPPHSPPHPPAPHPPRHRRSPVTPTPPCCPSRLLPTSQPPLAPPS